MNETTKRALTAAGTTLAIAGLTIAGAAAPAFAATTHHVSVTCDTATGLTTIGIMLAGYEILQEIPAYTMQVLKTPEVPGTDPRTVKGEVIIQASPGAPAVTEVQYEYRMELPGNGNGNGPGKDNPPQHTVRWFGGSGPDDSSVWVKTGASRTFVLTPEIPAQPEVRGPDLVIPGTPRQEAVWEDVLIPAIPGDETPNTMTLLIDDEVQQSSGFGAVYADSHLVDGTSRRTYAVNVEAAGQLGDVKLTGVTDPCAKAVPDEPNVPEEPSAPVVPAVPATPAVPVVHVTPPVPTKPAAATGTTKITSLASTGTSPWTIPALLGAVMMGLAGAAAVRTGRRAQRS